MKTTTVGCLQGDVGFLRVKSLPEGVKETKNEQQIIVAHSETDHHHVMDNSRGNVQFFSSSDPLVSYARVRGHVDVVHLRDWDTHETIRLDSEDGGEVIWEIRRQVENSPEGWKIVAD